MIFADRTDAGRRLGSRLQHLRHEPVVVLGLPRGGLPVAYEVARSLEAPLDVLLVRKLGVPFQRELAMGAIGEDDVRVVDDEVVRITGVSAKDLDRAEARERVELERRRRYRAGRPPIRLAGRTAVIVDDGIATGSTARAACRVARARDAARVVLAVPVAPPGWEERIGPDADEFVALETPEPFVAVGRFYGDFSQITDDEVVDILARSATITPDVAARTAIDAPMPNSSECLVDAAGVHLGGALVVPRGASGVVAFAHGSGSSRHSPRNRYVASVLNERGLATLLFDLLTVEEEWERSNVFDIAFLARRLAGATEWLRTQGATSRLPVGVFGASTGAAAALWVAAETGSDIRAVVSRGGRPDLAGDRLSQVRAPTLLIVGGRDEAVLDLNRRAAMSLTCEHRLAIVPGATHLFDEPGTLNEAAALAGDWFSAHLG